MTETRRGDLARFGKGLLRWPASGLTVFGVGMFVTAFAHGMDSSFLWLALAALVPFGFAAESAARWARNHEFRSPKLRYLWKLCEERLDRFDQAGRKYRKSELPELTELPITIARVAESLRLALRRADVMLHEVEQSEGGFIPPPVPNFAGVPPIAGDSPPRFEPSLPANPAYTHGLALEGSRPTDKETGALYQVADRNLAEYRAGLSSLLARISRTEAQAMVFATTLDTLRLRMLGYRLGARGPEMEHNDFLGSIGEAKMQINAIDRALEELEINVFTEPMEFPPIEPVESREFASGNDFLLQESPTGRTVGVAESLGGRDAGVGEKADENARGVQRKIGSPAEE